MKYILPTLALAFASTALHADEFRPALEEYLTTNVTMWVNDPVLVSAIRSANSVTAGYGLEQINAMDQAWRAEVGTATTPTITPVLNNEAAAFLRNIVDASEGTITEVFIMDGVGLNVAASGVTSDMWQGDEAKFTSTYAVGSDAIHISEVEFDESSQSYTGQISMTITDPDTGAPVGAITVGVNPERLF